jgi:transposase
LKRAYAKWADSRKHARQHRLGRWRDREVFESRWVVFRSAHDIQQGFRQRITDFLRSLELGNLDVR